MPALVRRVDTLFQGSDCRMKIAVIIPALNEESALPLVLADLPAVDRVIVVDNGSTDRTAQKAREGGAEVLKEPRRGYGRAVLTGLDALTSNPPDIVVILDADYSDHPDELPLLVGPIEKDEADLVIGSRVLGEAAPGSLPINQRLGNRLATFLIARLFRHRFTDLGPFRAIRYESLKALEMEDTDFGWNVEMQIKAVKSGLRIKEVPVHYRRRIGQSKISGTVRGTLRAGSKIMRTIHRYR